MRIEEAVAGAHIAQGEANQNPRLKECITMPRASAKAENAKAAPKAVSPADPFTFAWPTASAGIPAPTAIDSMRRMSEVQMDIARFAAERARKNGSTMAAFATCRSPMDFLEIWRKAATDAVADYADEAARFLERAQS